MAAVLSRCFPNWIMNVMHGGCTSMASLHYAACCCCFHSAAAAVATLQLLVLRLSDDGDLILNPKP